MNCQTNQADHANHGQQKHASGDYRPQNYEACCQSYQRAQLPPHNGAVGSIEIPRL
jgi:hypothetical protein